MSLVDGNYTIAQVGAFGLQLHEVRKIKIDYRELKPGQPGLVVMVDFVLAGKRKVLKSAIHRSHPFYVVFHGHNLPINAPSAFEKSSIPGGRVTRYGSFDPRYEAEASEAIDRFIAEHKHAPYLDLRTWDLRNMLAGDVP